MFNWKIAEVHAEDGVIKEVKYLVETADKVVSTEGYWRFSDLVAKTPFEQVTEEMVIDWVKEEATQYGKNIIESRLTEQLDALAKPKVLPPWVSQVFTLGEK